MNKEQPTPQAPDLGEETVHEVKELINLTSTLDSVERAHVLGMLQGFYTAKRIEPPVKEVRA